MMNNYKTFFTRICHTLAALLILFSVSSCERDMEMDIVSMTPPELHVVVHHGADRNDRIEGVTVKVYASAAERTEGVNLIAQVVTNAKGEAVFTKDKFVKGINYLAISRGDETVSAETPYLLQNDGQTLFWVAMN